MEENKSVKEMFENLGYKNIESEIEKENYCIAFKNDLDMIIVFFYDDKTFRKEFERKKYSEACSISTQELQAINKQVKELGW